MIIKQSLAAGVSAALAILAAGCASSGNEVLKAHDAAAVDRSILDGQTTREEVQKTYGQPSRVSFLNEKNEMWTYTWAHASAQGQNFIPIVGAFVRAYDVRSKELVIVFNEKNVVVRHSMTDNTRVVKSGLANTESAPAAPVQPRPEPKAEPSQSQPTVTTSGSSPAAAATSTPIEVQCVGDDGNRLRVIGTACPAPLKRVQ